MTDRKVPVVFRHCKRPYLDRGSHLHVWLASLQGKNAQNEYCYLLSSKLPCCTTVANAYNEWHLTFLTSASLLEL